MELGFNASQYCGGCKEREILGNMPGLLIVISLTRVLCKQFLQSQESATKQHAEFHQLVQRWEL